MAGRSASPPPAFGIMRHGSPLIFGLMMDHGHAAAIFWTIARLLAAVGGRGGGALAQHGRGAAAVRNAGYCSSDRSPRRSGTPGGTNCGVAVL